MPHFAGRSGARRPGPPSVYFAGLFCAGAEHDALTGRPRALRGRVGGTLEWARRGVAHQGRKPPHHWHLPARRGAQRPLRGTAKLGGGGWQKPPAPPA
jgi:hypothetical protein